MKRSRIAILPFVCALFLAVPGVRSNPDVANAGSHGSPRADHVRFCGSKVLYGHVLKLRERGELLPCGAVKTITVGVCKPRKVWTCFSLSPPGSLLSWVRRKELFAPRVSTVIEALRYPCRDAHVTAAAWTKARQNPQFHSPTRAQVLADDTLRCHLLAGFTEEEVVALLGPPDERILNDGVAFLDYIVGPERDSLFQIDPEYFSVEIGRNGRFTKAGFFQG